ncbi:MAG: hypothetical protein SCARUB_02752 [Candidatus Scalindua rubra]|uniref:Uncharacterized protein n=1 Tax=Candidatus Scalindua rubra TaxID=1872076 RepID=A0A1E3X915_9BACT|nr:MAG: hypothetical protein SCARUB_02752 [Candidatus Scalindua rubra]
MEDQHFEERPDWPDVKSQAIYSFPLCLIIDNFLLNKVIRKCHNYFYYDADKVTKHNKFMKVGETLDLIVEMVRISVV